MTCENVWPHSMISAEMPLSFCTRWSRTHKAWCDTALLNPVIHTEPSTQQHTERNRTSEWTLVRTLNARRSRDYRICGCHESKQGSEHEIHIFPFKYCLAVIGYSLRSVSSMCDRDDLIFSYDPQPAIHFSTWGSEKNDGGRLCKQLITTHIYQGCQTINLFNRD